MRNGERRNDRCQAATVSRMPSASANRPSAIGDRQSAIMEGGGPSPSEVLDLHKDTVEGLRQPPLSGRSGRIDYNILVGNLNHDH